MNTSQLAVEPLTELSSNRNKKKTNYTIARHTYDADTIYIWYMVCIYTVYLILKLIRVSYANFLSSPHISRIFLCAFKRIIHSIRKLNNKLNVIHVYMNLFICISYYLHICMVNQVSEISIKTKTKQWQIDEQ